MFRGAGEALRLGRPQHTRAAHRDGFEPFGAHDRAKPTAAGGALLGPPSRTRRVHVPLPGRPDGRHAGRSIAGAAADLGLGLPDVKAP